MAERLLGYKELCPMLGRSYKSIWRWQKEGKFPQPVKLGNRTLGWKESVINQWLDQQQGGEHEAR